MARNYEKTGSSKLNRILRIGFVLKDIESHPVKSLGKR